MQLQKFNGAGRVLDLQNNGTPYHHSFTQHELCNLVNPEILIGVSSCLFSGDDEKNYQQNTDSTILQSFDRHFLLCSFYPKEELNFGKAIQPVQLQNQIFEIDSHDETIASPDKVSSIKPTIQQDELNSRLSGYIFKANSPIAGANDYGITNTQNATDVDNKTLANHHRLNYPIIPLVAYNLLANPDIKDNFIQCVCVMHRWQQLAKQDATIYPLIRFHQQHRHLYLCHDPDQAAEIEAILTLKNKIDINELHSMYIQAVMNALSSIPSRENHTEVLQQLLAVIEPYLSSEDKEEIQQNIEEYQLDNHSITIPLTMLRYHIGQRPLPELINSVYLFPYPQERILCPQSEAISI